MNVLLASIDTDMLEAVDASNDAPQDVVRDVLAALERAEEDVYPASAAEVFAAWRAEQKQVDALFTTMM